MSNKSKLLAESVLSNSVFYTGHQAYKTLMRRYADEEAHSVLSKVAEFQGLVNDYWDKKEKEYSCKNYYDLPEQVREKGGKFLGIKLKILWKEGQEELSMIKSYSVSKKFILALKLICFNDYGFLREKETNNEKDL